MLPPINLLILFSKSLVVKKSIQDRSLFLLYSSELAFLNISANLLISIKCI